MARRMLRGDAVAVKQVWTVKAPAEVNQTITARIGNKSLTWGSWSASAIVTAWNLSTLPEFQEITATQSGTTVILTADTAGKPFEVQWSADTAPLVDEVQRVTLINGANGGTFAVEFDGDTVDVDWNVDGEEFQTELEFLDTLEPGDVTVTGPAGGPWDITFGGRFAGENVPRLEVDGTNLTGGNAAPAIATVQHGGGGSDPEAVSPTSAEDGYVFDVPSTGGGSSLVHPVGSMQFGGGTASGNEYFYHAILAFTLNVPRGANISDAYLNVHISGWASAGTLYAEAADNPTFPSLKADALTRPLTTTSAPVTFNPVGGTDWTVPNLEDVIQEIVDRPGWVAGNRIQLHLRASTLANYTVISPGVDYDSAPTLGVHFSAELREIQTVSLAGANIRGGTVTLSLDGSAMDPLPHTATAAEAQTAAEALPAVGAGNVTCTGGPWPAEIRFAFAASLGNLPQMTATDSLVNGDVQNVTLVAGGPTFVIEETQASQGPSHFDTPSNWEDDQGLDGEPETGDSVYLATAGVDVLYGLCRRCQFTASAATNRLTLATGRATFRNGQKVRVRSSTTLPAGLEAGTTYYVRDVSGHTLRLAATLDGAPLNLTTAGTGTHQIGIHLAALYLDAPYIRSLGLPRQAQRYTEYRPRFLQLWADLVVIGASAGNGPTLCYLDTQGLATVLILNRSNSGRDGTPAVQWVGDQAAALTVNGGDFGVAVEPDQEASFAGLNVNGGNVLIGRHVEMGDIVRTDGQIRSLGGTIAGTLTL